MLIMIRLIFTPERHHSSHSVIPATMAQGYYAVKSNMVFIIFMLRGGCTMCTAHAQKAGLLLKPPRTLILIFINCFSPAVSSVSEKIKIPSCFLVIL